MYRYFRNTDNTARRSSRLYRLLNSYKLGYHRVKDVKVSGAPVFVGSDENIWIPLIYMKHNLRRTLAEVTILLHVIQILPDAPPPHKSYFKIPFGVSL